MTIEEHIDNLKAIASDMPSDKCADWIESLMAGITALEQDQCGDCISRQAVHEAIAKWAGSKDVITVLPTRYMRSLFDSIHKLPSISPMSKMSYCKDCKHFEYDSVAKVDGIPLIVAHEICKRWGDGCKTKEDGYCFLFEPHEGGDNE